MDLSCGTDGGANTEVQKEQDAAAGNLKEKTTKAKRRAKQEAQRAAKAAAKGEGSKTAAAGVNSANAGKSVNPVPQKKDNSSVAASEKKSGDRQVDKDRKKDVPHPQMQFDDENRVEKAKKRSVVKQAEARNTIELFMHLPQYERGTKSCCLQGDPDMV